MSITIRSVAGADLYVAETATDVREALQKAVRIGANLVGADLVGANLARAYLAGANLAHADLARADLAGAYLVGANLVGADLAGANLAGANLAGAYLVGVNLAHADLAGANLARANLAGANLAGADLAGADLTGAIGINPHRVNDLLMLRDQPGPIRAYKLVDARLRSPIQSTGKLMFAVGSTVTAPSVNADETVQCGAGINLATLPWCMREWKPGWRILLVEFTAADIVAIPIGDGKFRVRACRVVGEKDLVELGLVERPA